MLARYPHLKWTSGRDSGQSDALSKGFRRATGKILAWLNSDDYYEPNVLGDIARYRFHYPARNLTCYRYSTENKSLSMARRQLREIYHVYRKNAVPFPCPVVKFLLSKSAHAYGLAPVLRPLAGMSRGRRTQV
jgi:glycosyltransferase involved in cell wall biosynthesis